MQSISRILRTWLALVVALASVGAAAQDRGAYQILQARYGTAAHNVDVTRTLQVLAQQDTQLRVTNQMFGVDPDVGVHKTLRIFARGQDGVIRTFEYTEGGTIDGTQFTGWLNGGWNYGGYNGGWEAPPAGAVGGDRGGYQILNARYGTAAHNMDVTNRLKELAARDQQFRITNALFGEDPDVGVHKTLRIYARDPSGVAKMLEFTEGGIIDGAQFVGWNTGNWGAPGYNYVGGWEGPMNPPQQADRGGYQILSARYGTASHNIDVTDRLIQLARQDDRVRVTNGLFGEDPAVGVHKTLRIYARDAAGATRMFEYTEGGWIDGTQFTGWRNGQWARDRRAVGWESGVAR